jgi:hypothetical protein
LFFASTRGFSASSRAPTIVVDCVEIVLYTDDCQVTWAFSWRVNGWRSMQKEADSIHKVERCSSKRKEGELEERLMEKSRRKKKEF